MKLKNYSYVVLIVILMMLLGYVFYLYKGCHKDYGHKVVVCIPVYGQSYALGEEAKRITNFD